MTAHLSIVPPSPKMFRVYLLDAGSVLVRANSYFATEYGTYAFYLEDIEDVNKAYNAGKPPCAVYESPRKNIRAVAEEGFLADSVGEAPSHGIVDKKAVAKRAKAKPKAKTKVAK